MSSSNPTPPEWKCGDTFLYRRPGLDNHLQVVLSNPTLVPARVVVVNFSSLRGYEERTCIIEPGEHPYATKRTCIPYRFAYMTSLAYLEEREANGDIERQEPLSPELLCRVLTGAALSVFMPTEIWDVIENQDLIDPF